MFHKFHFVPPFRRVHRRELSGDQGWRSRSRELLRKKGGRKAIIFVELLSRNQSPSRYIAWKMEFPRTRTEERKKSHVRKMSRLRKFGRPVFIATSYRFGFYGSVRTLEKPPHFGRTIQTRLQLRGGGGELYKRISCFFMFLGNIYDSVRIFLYLCHLHGFFSKFTVAATLFTFVWGLQSIEIPFGRQF